MSRLDDIRAWADARKAAGQSGDDVRFGIDSTLVNSDDGMWLLALVEEARKLIAGPLIESYNECSCSACEKRRVWLAKIEEPDAD